MKFVMAFSLRIKAIENIVVAILNLFVNFVGNYGVAIILTTILVKLLTLPLTIKQEKSMLKMKQLQPKLDEIKKQCGDDKVKYNEMTTKLYKDENINPLSGCLPLIIQLPIFVALYYTFLGDSIPNTATFLWFNLKKPDAIYTIGKFSLNILPIISTMLMVLQQKLMTNSSNGQEESVQNMMYAMPLVMMALFYNFPSGVNLYYTVNTLLAIVIQRLVATKVGNRNE